MPDDLPLRCACGAVHGVLRDVSADRGNRILCYCDDCQAFVRHLGAADRALDAHGGTDIFQTSAGRVAFADGRERLACLRLSPRGPLRWYASCCRTPIGNTMATRQLPFIGLIHTAFDPTLDPRVRDAVLGPVRARVYTRFANHAAPGAPDVDGGLPVAAILRFLRVAIGARLRGDQRRTPLFDATTGDPIAVPRLLDEAEQRAARSARDAP